MYSSATVRMMHKSRDQLRTRSDLVIWVRSLDNVPGAGAAAADL